MGIFRKRPHERQMDVDMGIDKPGKDVFSFRINDLGAGRRLQIPVDTGDHFVFAPDIGDVAFAGGYDLTILD
jgi:hypothetical protein